MRKLIHIALLLFLMGTLSVMAQSNEQKKLEAERARLQQEIKQVEQLLFKNTAKEKSALDQIEDLNHKIQIRQQLIRVTNQQANLFQRQITSGEQELKKLQTELKQLKADYAAMIRKSYVSKSSQNRLLFLLSSKDFFQALRRIAYMKQYAQYRRKQGEVIAKTTEKINIQIADLKVQKAAKDALIASNKKENANLEADKSTAQSSLTSIRKNKRKYKKQIDDKIKESKDLDDRIEKLIKEAIAAANKKANEAKTSTAKSTSSTSNFVLTPEAKRIASSFEANKGKLIWPVEKGVVKRGFGIYTDPVYPEIKHQNNGVIIATAQGTNARAIFQGEVVAIIKVPGGSLGVQIRHGNYITTYYNLKSVSVSKGDQVVEKQPVGVVNTNPFNGQTQLKFYLYQNTLKLNPQLWIYKL